MPVSTIALGFALLSQLQNSNAFRVVESTETVKNRFEISTKLHRFLGNGSTAQAMNERLFALEDQVVRAFKNGSIGAPIRTPWTLDIATQLTLNRRNLVSVLLHQFEYTGGAHPNQLFHCITIGSFGGKDVQLSEKHLVDGTYRRGQLQALLLNKLRERGAAWIEDGSVNSLTDAQLSNFLVRESGMTWHFNPYEMGPYVQGPFSIDCNWKELAPILDRKVAPLLMGGV